VAVVPVRAGARLEATTHVARGPHLLEVWTVSGGRVVPGQVELAR